MSPRALFLDTDRVAFDAVAATLAAEGIAAGYVGLDGTGLDGVELDGVAALIVTAARARAIAAALSQRELSPVLIVCGDGGAEVAVELGVDYLSDPGDPAIVTVRLRVALERWALLEAAASRRRLVDEGFEGLLGVTPSMTELYHLIDRAARTNTSVLITGESGTGKELVARALHRRSRRSAGPMVSLNCSSVPESLLETELFGHVRGAFTDARADRAGLFASAHGGTLFLDEIGDLPLALQPKLLRALQERTIRPVGADVETAVDVRVIAATLYNLEAAVAERRFREDLYYRLNVIHIPVPPLRERVGDIPLLAARFVRDVAAALDKPVGDVGPRVNERLISYPWPGNVRELENTIERAVALCEGDRLEVDDLPPRVRDYRRSHVLVVSNEPSELLTLDELERRYIVEVLDRVGGNKVVAARVLGIDRKTLYRKLARYNLGPPEPAAD